MSKVSCLYFRSSSGSFLLRNPKSIGYILEVRVERTNLGIQSKLLIFLEIRVEQFQTFFLFLVKLLLELKWPHLTDCM